MTFILGDCTAELPKLPDASVDLILTDPPYRISKAGAFKGGIKRFEASHSFGEWDCLGDDALWSLMRLYARQAYRLLKPGGTAITFFDRHKTAPLIALLKEAGFKCEPREITWIKPSIPPRNQKTSYLVNSVEKAILVWKGSNPTFHRTGERDTDWHAIYRCNTPRGRVRIHPTQKPQELFEALIRRHSNPGDLVLDPFCGARTTLAACKATSRVGLGIDLVDYLGSKTPTPL